MKVLVTGTPGSGKTTLVAFANNMQDMIFVDADEVRGLCEWRNFRTGDVIGMVDEVPINAGDGWYKDNGWYWRIDAMKALLSRDEDMIFCGSSENIVDFYPLFDKIIILRKTKEQLLHNLKSPNRANPFGKTTKQRAGFMKWQDYLIKEAAPYNPIFVDTNDIKNAYAVIIDCVKNPSKS